MSETIEVVCPACDQVNRFKADKPAAKAVCGRCQTPLFQGQPIDLGGDRFDKHVARTTVPVIVDFWAPWCGPCRAMAPVFERAARELEPRARFLKVDVDENPDLASRLSIRGIPALFAFSGGKAVAQHAGMVDFNMLDEWVTRLNR